MLRLHHLVFYAFIKQSYSLFENINNVPICGQGMGLQSSQYGLWATGTNLPGSNVPQMFWYTRESENYPFGIVCIDNTCTWKKWYCSFGSYFLTSGTPSAFWNSWCSPPWCSVDDIRTDNVHFGPENQDPICTVCPYGYEQSTVDDKWKICLQCSTYCGSSGGTSKCTCTACPAGSSIRSNYMGRTEFCSPCSAGSYSIGMQNTVCTLCPAGTYSAMTGLTACNFCDVGSYASSVGSLYCQSCANGLYATGLGLTKCTTCSEPDVY